MTADVVMFEISAAALIKNDKNEAQVYGILCGVEFEKKLLSTSLFKVRCSSMGMWRVGGRVGVCTAYPMINCLSSMVELELIGLRDLVRSACSRETHVSVYCTVFHSSAPCCSAPVAIEDRYYFQHLICKCLALKKTNNNKSLTPGLSETR